MDVELTTEQMMAEVSKDTAAAPSNETPTQQTAENAGSAVTQQTAEELLGLDKYGKHFVEYKANGKPVRETLEQALARSSQGYNYAQLVAELKQKEPGWQKQLEERDTKLKEYERYKQYVEYGAKNPAWAKHVEDMYSNKERYNNESFDPNDPITQRLASIEQSLAKFSNQYGEKLSKYDQMVEAQENAKSDAELTKEVDTVKGQFKEVDFDVRDESGRSVTSYVMEHMVTHKIANFRTAFLDLYHDQILTMKEQMLRDKHAKEVQKKTKAGIIDIKSTPNGKDKAPLSNIRSMSWDEISNMAKKEAGYG